MNFLKVIFSKQVHILFLRLLGMKTVSIKVDPFGDMSWVFPLKEQGEVGYSKFLEMKVIPK